MPKLDQLDKIVPKASRALRRMNTEVEVGKAIRDNLKGVSAAELFTNTDSSGCTLRQSLCDRKRKNKEDPHNHPLGGPFYEELRATYQNADAPSKRLKAKDISQPLSENLLKAMMAYRRNQSNRGPFNPAISSLQDVNQYELVAERSLVAIDSNWKTDHMWMISMIGDAGEMRLMRLCLAKFPTEAIKRTLTEVYKDVKTLQVSSLAKFCIARAQGHLQSVFDVLSLMVSGKSPGVSGTSTQLMTKVFAALPYLIRVDFDGRELFGQRAVETILKNLMALGVPKLSVNDIEPVVVYRWLLKPDDQQKALGLQADASQHVKAAVGGNFASAGGEAASSSGSAKGSKRGIKEGKTEMEWALAMFQGGL